MKIVEIVFYLIVSMDQGTVIVPEPMTEKACRAEAARINRPKDQGGERNAFAACVRVERITSKV